MATLDLTPGESDHVQLAQEKRNKLVNEGIKLAQEGEAVLRRAVERIFNDHKATIPTGNVSITNGADGSPAAFSWEEASAAPAGAVAESDETADDGVDVDPTPAEPAARAPNGAKPEATKRKLPTAK